MLTVDPRARPESNLSYVARQGISGAKYLFDSLDYYNKYYVLPVAAGRPLGMATSSGEVLDAWGARPSKEALGGWARPAAEFATGALLDWTNLISFGGKTAAGQVLKRAGQFDNAVAQAGKNLTDDFVRNTAKRTLAGTTDPERLQILKKALSEQPVLTQRALENFGQAGLVKHAPAYKEGFLSQANIFARPQLADNLNSKQMGEFLSSVKKLDLPDLNARNLHGHRTLSRTAKLEDVVDLARPSDELLQATQKMDPKKAEAYLKSLGKTTLTNDVGLRVPFSERDLIGFKIPGLGKVRAESLDRLGDFVRWSPLGRGAYRLFAQSAGNKYGAGEQILAKEIYDAGQEGAREGRRIFQNQIADIPNEDFAPELGEKLRAYIEKGKYGADIAKAPALKDFGKEWVTKIQPGWLADRRNAGLSNAEMVRGGIRYFPRQAGEDVYSPTTARAMKKAAGRHTSTPDLIGRKDYMGDFEGGTEVVNKLSVDPNVRAFSGDGDAADYIIQEMKNAGYAAPPKTSAIQLASAIRSMSPRAAKQNVPLFGHSPFQDLERYTVSNSRALAVSDRLYDILARQATRGHKYDFKDHASLMGAAQQLGLKSFKNKATKQVVGARPQLMQRLGVTAPKDMVKYSVEQTKVDALKKLGQIAELPEVLQKFLDNFIDPAVNLFRQSVLAWPSRFTRDFISSTFVNGVEVGVGTDMVAGYRAQRQLMNGDFEGLFKTIGNSPRYYQFQASGTKPADLNGFIDQVRRDLVDSGIIQGKKSMDMAHRLERAAGASDILATYRPGSEPVATVGSNLLSGRFTNPFKDTATEKYAKAWINSKDKLGDMWAIGAPGQDLRDIRNPFFRWSADLGDTTDQINRNAGYFGLIRQGVSPQEAGRRMLAAHIDYASLTEFERNIMKRIFPFWSYSSRIGKYITEKIWDTQGGRYKELVLRGPNRDSDEEERYTPSTIRRKYGFAMDGDDVLSRFGRAVLAPQSPPGVTPWLSDIDLPGVSLMNNIEIAVKPGHTGQLYSHVDGLQTLKNAVTGYLSEASPMVKDPYEFFSGTDTSTGRSWKNQYTSAQRILKNTTGLDKHSLPGQALGFIDPLIKYLPMGSRIANLGAKLTDAERVPDLRSRLAQGAFDTMTGVKIRNIEDDVEAAEALRLIEGMLENDPYIREYGGQYILEDERELASPHTIRLLELARKIRQQRNSGR